MPLPDPIRQAQATTKSTSDYCFVWPQLVQLANTNPATRSCSYTSLFTASKRTVWARAVPQRPALFLTRPVPLRTLWSNSTTGSLALAQEVTPFPQDRLHWLHRGFQFRLLFIQLIQFLLSLPLRFKPLHEFLVFIATLTQQPSLVPYRIRAPTQI